MSGTQLRPAPSSTPTGDRRLWTALGYGVAAGVVAYATWLFGIGALPDDVGIVPFAAVALAPVLGAPACGAYLIFRRRMLACGIAVILGAELAAVLFFLTVLLPLGSQMD